MGVEFPGHGANQITPFLEGQGTFRKDEGGKPFEMFTIGRRQR
jgi:hypothetical protein